jgi:hypothetical protein
MLKSKSIIYFAITLSILLVVGCTKQVSTKVTETPTQAFTSYVDAINKGDYTVAWSKLDANGQAQFGSLNNFKKHSAWVTNAFQKNVAVVAELTPGKKIPAEFAPFEKEIEVSINESSAMLLLNMTDYPISAPLLMIKDETGWKLNAGGGLPSFCKTQGKIFCVDHEIDKGTIAIVLQNSFDSKIELRKVVFSGDDVTGTCEIVNTPPLAIKAGSTTHVLKTNCEILNKIHAIDLSIYYSMEGSSEIKEEQGLLFTSSRS